MPRLGYLEDNRKILPTRELIEFAVNSSNR
jgi:hypothetical protein